MLKHSLKMPIDDKPIEVVETANPVQLMALCSFTRLMIDKASEAKPRPEPAIRMSHFK